MDRTGWNANRDDGKRFGDSSGDEERELDRRRNHKVVWRKDTFENGIAVVLGKGGPPGCGVRIGATPYSSRAAVGPLRRGGIFLNVLNASESLNKDFEVSSAPY